MAKMKGFFKGFKYISQIFVYKEHELEIGYPTDVRHVAHIGWDGSSTNAPGWMNEFKTASDFTSSSLSNFGDHPNSVSVGSWASQDFLQASPADIFDDLPRTEPPKKSKRKKSKSASASSSSSRSSRSSKSRAASFAAAIGEE
ncbi:hypothetical protein QJS04_geneDACA019884 [Acorus gramineus]|uniref:CRIB domain-containing protein n=1 Tax=Acorus gramineus TaxID=55184 RepID=A0AAV9BUG3_ACOGR|nr:hypothetical protein QJS04_geneDACA019884 [Acorus gramineus]